MRKLQQPRPARQSAPSLRRCRVKSLTPVPLRSGSGAVVELSIQHSEGALWRSRIYRISTVRAAGPNTKWSALKATRNWWIAKLLAVAAVRRSRPRRANGAQILPCRSAACANDGRHLRWVVTRLSLAHGNLSVFPSTEPRPLHQLARPGLSFPRCFKRSLVVIAHHSCANHYRNR
jgi:hypothetical protein